MSGVGGTYEGPGGQKLHGDGTPVGKGVPLKCVGCGLEWGEAYPKEPSVQVRSDGKVRCNDCEQSRVNPPNPVHPAFGIWKGRLANRDIEEAVLMMDHPPVHRSCFILGMELAMRIVRNSRETFFNGTKPDDTLLGGITEMIRLVQVEIGAGRMDLPQKWTQDEIDEIRRIS
jgi:hypothetical protein